MGERLEPEGVGADGADVIGDAAQQAGDDLAAALDREDADPGAAIAAPADAQAVEQRGLAVAGRTQNQGMAQVAAVRKRLRLKLASRPRSSLKWNV